MSEIFYRDVVFYLRDQCPGEWLSVVDRRFHDQITILSRPHGFADVDGYGQKSWIRGCQRVSGQMYSSECKTLKLEFGRI